MNPENEGLTPAVQRLLDQHMDAVDRQLASAGKSRTDRRRICDDLEGQIREMLAQRTSGAASENDLRAVLAELDKPEAYGELDAETAGVTSATSAQWALPRKGFSPPTEAESAPVKPRASRSLLKVLLILFGLYVLFKIATIAIVAVIAVPNFLEAQTRSKVSRVRADQRSMATAIEAYYIDNKVYPAWTDGEGSAFGGLIHDPALRGQSTFRDRDLTQLATLTTPVAYLTSYFTGEFADGKMVVPSYYSNGQTWITWSAGPDKKYDLDLNSARGLIDPTTNQIDENKALAFRYDPTNGINSVGDVIRTKQ